MYHKMMHVCTQTNVVPVHWLVVDIEWNTRGCMSRCRRPSSPNTDRYEPENDAWVYHSDAVPVHALLLSVPPHDYVLR